MRLVCRSGLSFIVHDWLDLPALLARPRYCEHTPESSIALMDLAEKLASTRFVTHYKEADQAEPRLDEYGVHIHPKVVEAVQAFCNAGFSSVPFDVELGGLQAPDLLHNASMSLFMAGNIATAAYSVLSIANARLLATFGTPEQIKTFAEPQITGKMLGTMCLSEPQAGSSLSDIATRATTDGADALGARYRLHGNKMWISAGDHTITQNILHLVLAKIPGDNGTLDASSKKISLFAVPKFLPDGERNDIGVAGLNHKMGYRATSNCLLNFGEGTLYRPRGQGGAIGWLIGQPGQGLAIMFHMMNEARLSVGLGSAALAWRAHLLSVDYARERLQGRTPDRKPDTRQIPIIQHADIKRMLLAQKAYAEGAMALILYCSRLVDDHRTAAEDHVRKEAHICLDLLTPVAKTWPSEWGLAANDLAIQIHGGYGYTRDFDVEQLYRDNRLNAIHEGTTGIQAIDLLGRKTLRDSGAALAVLERRIATTCSRARAHANLTSFAAQVETAITRVVQVATKLVAAKEDVAAMWNATAYLSGFGHVVVAWLWLDMARVVMERADMQHTPFGEGKLRACRYFIEIELPKVNDWLMQAEVMTDVAATMPVAAFD